MLGDVGDTGGVQTIEPCQVRLSIYEAANALDAETDRHNVAVD
jgi:hypothetical protein